MVQIYGTIGPSCSTREVLKQMIMEGMTGIRLNTSHASLRQSAELISRLRAAERETQKKVDLMIDLQGPELRVGVLPEPLILAAGEQIETEKLRLPRIVLDSIRSGDVILLDDGKIELISRGSTMDITRGGTLNSRKSVKIKDREITGPVLTEADLENIALIREYGVDAVMQPFVHNAADLLAVRAKLKENGCEDVRIFAKIETLSGAANIEEIMHECDVTVIARGDLGNNMPLWQLPPLQKKIEEECVRQGKPFMVVTEMLTSMIHSPIPTRAEVSDIFNACADGASYVMATNETAVGKYPAEVIRYLYMCACEGENYRKKQTDNCKELYRK